MSVAERLAAGFQMTEFIRASVRARIRAEHSEWSDTDVDAELAQRILRRDV